ncbi:MAG: TIR domain-containing protein [Bdellovibrionales bacterium]
MFRAKRGDTKIQTVEATYGLDLNVRDDQRLGNLLASRGYESLSELRRAYAGHLSYHPRRRKAFISFHSNDLRLVQGFRLMLTNPNLQFDVDDSLSRRAVRSDSSNYIRQALKSKILASDVLICMVGNGTAWRDWVEWEVETAIAHRIPVCGVRLKESRGRTPPVLKEIGAPIAGWEPAQITSAIEQAIARGI